jgi:hypothetical protein
LLGALTTIGLSGTIAVTGSALCGYQIFSTFEWYQTADMLLALQISGVIVLLEALLFLPSYSIPASLSAAAPSSSSISGSSSTSQPQQQLVDMTAVKAAGLWSGDSWLLLLALYTAALQRPQVEQLPQQVRQSQLLSKIAADTRKHTSCDNVAHVRIFDKQASKCQLPRIAVLLSLARSAAPCT